VPEGQYFMMGDSRDNSQDSRFWGFLPATYVKGQALFIYFSVEEGASWTGLLGSLRWGRIFDRVR
jgi:signal peptidase I